MAAKNPRLTVTLKPSLKAQIERLSELTGNSQGALVSDLLEGSQPVFARLITVLEAAHEARESLSSRMSADLEAVQGQLEAQLGIAMDLFDEGSRPLLEVAEEVHRRARRGTARGPRGAGDVRAVAGSKTGRVTPPSNRGVRSKTKKAGKLSGAMD